MNVPELGKKGRVLNLEFFHLLTKIEEEYKNRYWYKITSVI